MNQQIKKLKTKTYLFLKWSEKYTKTDMIYLTKGGFWLFISQIISSLASFLLVIAFANLLPKETFGTYKYILSLGSILLIPALPGINTAVNMAAARGLDGTLALALKTKIHWGFFSSLASLLLAGYYFLNGNLELAISLLIVSFFLPFMEAFALYIPFLNGKKKFDTLTKYNAIIHVASSLILIGIVFLTKNLFLIILSYFLSWTVLRYIFYKLTTKKFIFSKEKDDSAISYGKHLSLMKITNTIASYIDKIFVFHFLGAVPLAIYSFAIAMPEQIKGALSLLDTLAFPNFVTRKTNEIKASFKKKALRLFLLGAIVIGSYILIAPLLYKTFFPQYEEAVFYSQLFALSMLNMTLFPATTALRAKRNIKELYISNFIVPIFQIGIMLVFIIWKGLLGLIIARIISRFFGGLLDTFLFYRTSSNNAEELSQPELIK